MRERYSRLMEVVEDLATGLKAKQIAGKFGVSDQQIRNWKKEFFEMVPVLRKRPTDPNQLSLF